MAYFKGILSVVLACLIHAQSVPLSPGDDALTRYTLKFYMNTNTSLFNSTDLSKPLAQSYLQVWTFSDGSPRLADTTDALHDKIASLPAAHQVAAPQMTVSNSAGKGDLPLVFSYNQTEMFIVGPKRYYSVLSELQLKLWAKKW